MDMLRQLVAGRIDFFILLLLRASGLVFASPVFGRKNLPNMVKIGLSGSIAVLLFYALPPVELEYHSVLGFVLVCLTELLFGIVLGYVQNLFFAIVQISGHLFDMQMGFGMANVLDQQTGTSVPMTGALFNYMVMLAFFVTGGHLDLIRIMYITFVKLPVGGVNFNPEMGKVALELFVLAFATAIRIALPVIASGLLSETAMGIMMRTVPQINMFVVGIPIKIVLGFIVIFFSLPLMMSFSNFIFESMFEGLEKMFATMLPV